MPKKTRREKILAQQHKKELLEKQTFNPDTLSTETGAVTITQNPASAPKKLSFAYKPETDELTKKYFISDLRKSLLFVGVIFTLEFFLYFVTVFR